MEKLFGTDGIRGVAGEFPLDRMTIYSIGCALAETLLEECKNPRILIGRDTRESGMWITEELVEALGACGVASISDVAVISTPGLAYLTRIHRFDMGIMISASHNPFEDNGIKVFGRDGYKLTDDVECKTEERIYHYYKRNDRSGRRRNHSRNNSEDCSQLVHDYTSFLTKQFDSDLTPFRIGLDVCHGAAFSIAPKVFGNLGASVLVINDQPNGRNINQGCGSLHLDGITKLVRKNRLDFGIAFDGDADRSLFITAKGEIFDGDHILYALSLYFQRKNQLKSGKVVGTVMTNFALEVALGRKGINLIRAAVGDRYVLEEMKKVGANLGGEPSGHVILSDYHTTGDGMLTAVTLAWILSSQSQSLDALSEGFQPFPQVLDGLRVQKKIPLSTSPEIINLIREAEMHLKGTGRMVVRYSGTEPLLRIMAEGEDKALVRSLVNKLKRDLELQFSSIS